jgi:hypothetical protein
MSTKAKDTERLSVSLKRADVALLLKLRQQAEAVAGRPMKLAPIVRDAIQALAKERGVA